MDAVLQNQSVVRIKQVMQELGVMGEVKVLSESARTAAEAAAALGVTAGQIASSIVFKLPSGNPLLVITSGAHRVDANLVAKNIGVEKLHRADADFVKNASGISIGGVSPLGWISKPEIILIDEA
ncbi:MAG: YbaK/EbsC family protein, partial [Actinomycetes bacterium]